MCQRGFSLLEVLVAAGIVSFIGLAMTSTTVNLLRQNKGLQQKLESIELEQNIVRLLSDGTSCDCIFNGYSFSDADITDGIKNGCSGYLIKPNSMVSPEGSGLKIKSIKLDDVNVSQKTADLLIDFNQESIVGALKPIRIKSLKFILNGSNIDRCFGSLGTKEFCLNLGWTWESNKCTFQTAQQTCVSLGGTWDTNKCRISSAANIASEATPTSTTSLDCGATPNGGYSTRITTDCRKVSYPDNCHPDATGYTISDAFSSGLNCQSASYKCTEQKITSQCVGGIFPAANQTVQSYAYYSSSDVSH